MVRFSDLTAYSVDHCLPADDVVIAQPQAPRAPTSFRKRAGYFFYLNRAFQVQWHCELVRQQEKSEDGGRKQCKDRTDEESGDRMLLEVEAKQEMQRSPGDDQEDSYPSTGAAHDVDDRRSPAMSASSSSHVISRNSPPEDGSKLMNLNFLLHS